MFGRLSSGWSSPWQRRGSDLLAAEAHFLEQGPGQHDGRGPGLSLSWKGGRSLRTQTQPL